MESISWRSWPKNRSPFPGYDLFKAEMKANQKQKIEARRMRKKLLSKKRWCKEYSFTPGMIEGAFTVGSDMK